MNWKLRGFSAIAVPLIKYERCLGEHAKLSGSSTLHPHPLQHSVQLYVEVMAAFWLREISVGYK